MKKTIIILTVLLFAFPTDVVAGDREDLVAAIEKRWIDTAKKQISPGDSNPAGAWLQLLKVVCGNFRLPQKL